MSQENTVAVKRASMPAGANKVLDRRSLEYGSKNLLPLLKGVHRVLDVGCGSGSITKGIAERVSGDVVGIDMSADLISQAQSRFAAIPNLTFLKENIHTFRTEQKFDLITSARTLQWISTYRETLATMKGLLSPGGCLAVLDYNHEKIEWSPEPPPSMREFYSAFLRWRQNAGMNNAIADHLEEAFVVAGLTNISTTDESEISSRHDADFIAAAGIWNVVAETRGLQMVNDGYITETQRINAITDYGHWLNHDGQSMKLYLVSVVGYHLN